MHYFFLEGRSLAAGGEAELAREDINHAYRVLRLRVGDEVAVADGRGTVRQGLVRVSEPQKVLVSLGKTLPSSESLLEITILQSLVKGEKFDLIIRQAVELGVKRIIPVTTERSIPRFYKRQAEIKLQRWRSIARSAAAQCRRGGLPPVEPLFDFETALRFISGKKTLVPWEEEKNVSLVQVLKQLCPRDRAVALFIGPEGGFTPTEIEAMLQAGALPVHLGPRIMRTETAAAAAVTLIQALWGDLSGEGSAN